MKGVTTTASRGATHPVRDGLLGLLGEDVGEDSTETHADAQHVDRRVLTALRAGLKWEKSAQDHFFFHSLTPFLSLSPSPLTSQQVLIPLITSLMALLKRVPTSPRCMFMLARLQLNLRLRPSGGGGGVRIFSRSLLLPLRLFCSKRISA